MCTALDASPVSVLLLYIQPVVYISINSTQAGLNSSLLQFASLFASIETARISTIATGFTKFSFKVCAHHYCPVYHH